MMLVPGVLLQLAMIRLEKLNWLTNLESIQRLSNYSTNLRSIYKPKLENQLENYDESPEMRD